MYHKSNCIWSIIDLKQKCNRCSNNAVVMVNVNMLLHTEHKFLCETHRVKWMAGELEL